MKRLALQYNFIELLGEKHMKRRILFLFVCLCLILVGCGRSIGYASDIKEDNISVGTLRKTVFALVSSAENSTTDYSGQYA